MHPQTAYVRRRGDSFSFRRRPPVHPSLAHRGNNTRPHLTVALWTRDPREAARRAARLNVIAEAGWAVGLSESDMLGLLKVVAHLGAQLPDMPPAQRVEAERRIDDEARKAIAGQPHRLDDPDFLDAFGWVEMPAAAEVAEQLEASIAGHIAAYDDALRRGEAPVAAMELLRARLAPEAPVQGLGAAEGNGSPSESAGVEAAATVVSGEDGDELMPEPRPARRAPASGGAGRKPARLRPNDQQGWVVFAGRYLDRRLAGYLCERPEEVASPAVGERFLRGSSGNYQAAIRLWADAMGNRRPRDYTPQDVIAFLELLGKVPKTFGKSSNRKPVRETIREADEQEAIAVAEVRSRLRNALPGIREEEEEQARIPRLRTATIQRYQQNLGQVFDWAVATGAAIENPFARGRLSPKALAARRAAEPDPEREPWGKLLPTLLGSRIYRGRPEDPGDPLFWCPLLALLAGLREEESLQLRVEDFTSEDGVDYIAVRQGLGQRLKSAQGRRRVPVHSELIRLGLLRLVAMRRRGRLFPGAKRGKSRGTLTEIFTKTFGDYLVSEKIKAPGLDFHALRGDFNTQMDAAGVPRGIRGVLCGWGEDTLGLADGTYLRGLRPVERLRGAVETIRIEAITKIQPVFPDPEQEQGACCAVNVSRAAL